jgi:RNA polymerase sigma-70 factor (ECF subfamily)
VSAPFPASDELPAANPALTHWFLAEVRPHEAALRAYVRVRFPTLTEIDDLIQETFARILRAHSAGQVRSPKALLFATARNTALDLLRRRQVVRFESLANLDDSFVLEDGPGTVESLSREQELQLLDEAVQSLPDRCRQILIMKKIDGLSYAEIGEKLGISANTISAQLTIGVLRCRRFLEERGVLKGRNS